MAIINWRKIADVGYPTDDNIDYIVTDGTDLSVTGITGTKHFKGDGNPTFTFGYWTGDENVWEDNSCCAGERMFDMTPTHWCPASEIDLPK